MREPTELIPFLLFALPGLLLIAPGVLLARRRDEPPQRLVGLGLLVVGGFMEVIGFMALLWAFL
jgi:hypothetical protein